MKVKNQVNFKGENERFDRIANYQISLYDVKVVLNRKMNHF